MQTLKYHPLLWQSCHGTDQSVDCRAPFRCRLRFLLWDFVDHCHAIWSSETSPQCSTKPDQCKKEWKLPNKIWLLLDGVTSSSAGLFSHKTWNNLLMQMWNLVFCWRSWYAISKLHLKTPLILCFCHCSQGKRSPHPVTLANSCVHLNFFLATLTFQIDTAYAYFLYTTFSIFSNISNPISLCWLQFEAFIYVILSLFGLFPY